MRSTRSVDDHCRICFRGESYHNLIHPCNCKGSMKWVHRACLEKWLKLMTDPKCEICKFKYRVQRVPRSWEDWWRSIANTGYRRELVRDALYLITSLPLYVAGIALCMYLMSRNNMQGNVDWKTLILVLVIIFQFFCTAVYLTWLLMFIGGNWYMAKRWRLLNGQLTLVLNENRIWRRQRIFLTRNRRQPEPEPETAVVIDSGPPEFRDDEFSVGDNISRITVPDENLVVVPVNVPSKSAENNDNSGDSLTIHDETVRMDLQEYNAAVYRPTDPQLNPTSNYLKSDNFGRGLKLEMESSTSGTDGLTEVVILKQNGEDLHNQEPGGSFQHRDLGQLLLPRDGSIDGFIKQKICVQIENTPNANQEIGKRVLAGFYKPRVIIEEIEEHPNVITDYRLITKTNVSLDDIYQNTTNLIDHLQHIDDVEKLQPLDASALQETTVGLSDNAEDESMTGKPQLPDEEFLLVTFSDTTTYRGPNNDIFMSSTSVNVNSTSIPESHVKNEETSLESSSDERLQDMDTSSSLHLSSSSLNRLESDPNVEVLMSSTSVNVNSTSIPESQVKNEGISLESSSDERLQDMDTSSFLHLSSSSLNGFESDPNVEVLMSSTSVKVNRKSVPERQIKNEEPLSEPSSQESLKDISTSSFLHLSSSSLNRFESDPNVDGLITSTGVIVNSTNIPESQVKIEEPSSKSSSDDLKDIGTSSFLYFSSSRLSAFESNPNVDVLMSSTSVNVNSTSILESQVKNEGPSSKSSSEDSFKGIGTSSFPHFNSSSLSISDSGSFINRLISAQSLDRVDPDYVHLEQPLPHSEEKVSSVSSSASADLAIRDGNSVVSGTVSECRPYQCAEDHNIYDRYLFTVISDDTLNEVWPSESRDQSGTIDPDSNCELLEEEPVKEGPKILCASPSEFSEEMVICEARSKESINVPVGLSDNGENFVSKYYVTTAPKAIAPDFNAIEQHSFRTYRVRKSKSLPTVSTTVFQEESLKIGKFKSASFVF